MNDIVKVKPMSVAERAAQALNREEAEREILKLVEQSKPIVTVTDAASRDIAHKAMTDLKNLRIKIEKQAKDGREEAVQYSKAVIAIEKDLVKLISPEEQRLLARKAAEPKPRSGKRKPPPKEELLAVLADHYRVTPAIVEGWLSIQRWESVAA